MESVDYLNLFPATIGNFWLANEELAAILQRRKRKTQLATLSSDQRTPPNQATAAESPSEHCDSDQTSDSWPFSDSPNTHQFAYKFIDASLFALRNKLNMQWLKNEYRKFTFSFYRPNHPRIQLGMESLKTGNDGCVMLSGPTKLPPILSVEVSLPPSPH